MSKEIIEGIVEIARQIEEQLKFYREIGVSDIGGSARDTELAPVAVSVVEAATESLRIEEQPQDREAMPKKTSTPEQPALFGDIAPAREPRAKGAQIPIIQP